MVVCIPRGHMTEQYFKLGPDRFHPRPISLFTLILLFDIPSHFLDAFLCIMLTQINKSKTQFPQLLHYEVQYQVMFIN